MFKVVVSGLALMFAGACSEDSGTDAVGGLGLACYPNGTCNVGLECVRGVCAPEADEEVTSDVTSQETTPDTTLSQETTPDTTPAEETTPDTTTQETTSGETADVDAQTCTGGVCGPFYAVIVTDSMIFPNHRGPNSSDPCATSFANMHGADIDAVALFDADNLLGYLDNVDYADGGICTGDQANAATDPSRARGAPNASLTSGFVSLGGGWLAGEFDSALEIVDGSTVVVYEAGSSCSDDPDCGGLDEGYEIFVATDLDCASQGDYPWNDCALLLGAREGEGSIPFRAF